MRTTTLDDCERIFSHALSSESESAFCYAVQPLFREYEILSLELGRGSIFWRGRIIEDEAYQNLSQLDYPPPELAKQGRVNDRGVPCFYIAARKETALVEVGAREGQLVQLAGFLINSEFPVRLAVIGEFSNVQKNGYMHFAGKDPDTAIGKILNEMPRSEALKKLYIDKFFASVLADPAAAASGYMFSRALAQSIYSRVEVDGIVFPSVKDRGGFNVAVKAEQSDKSFINSCCLVTRMGRLRQYGLIEFTVVKSAKRLDDDWNFVWSDADTESGIMSMYNMSRQEYETASRYAKDRNGLLHVLRSNAPARSA